MKKNNCENYCFQLITHLFQFIITKNKKLKIIVNELLNNEKIVNVIVFSQWKFAKTLFTIMNIIILNKKNCYNYFYKKIKKYLLILMLYSIEKKLHYFNYSIIFKE